MPGKITNFSMVSTKRYAALNLSSYESAFVDIANILDGSTNILELTRFTADIFES